MKISESVETSKGVVQFVGEVHGAELDLIIQAGLFSLMTHGIIREDVIPDKGEQH